jgi:hypothetical protein
MKIATRYARAQEMLKSNVHYIKEIEDLCHQINMLKLGINTLSVTPAQSTPLLNHPYEECQPKPQNNFFQNPPRNNRNNNNQWWDGPQCWNCLQYGHIAQSCLYPCNNHRRNLVNSQWLNNNQWCNNNNNNNQRRQNNPPNNVGNWKINTLSIPSIREYDIVPDI